MADSPVVFGLDFGGTKIMAQSWDRLRPGLHYALSTGAPCPPELVIARFPAAAPLIGAVALAVDAISPRGDHGDGHHVNLSSVMLSEGIPT